MLQPQYQGGGGNNGSIQQLIPKKESRFKGGEYKDLWALALWVVCLLGFAGVSGYSLQHLNDKSGNATNPNSGASNSDGVAVIPAGRAIGVVVAISAVMGGLLSLGYFTLMQKYLAI